MNKIHPGISRHDYFKLPGINISTLIEGVQSMAHLKYTMENRGESSDAMERGTALHLAVFEPSEFEKRVTYYPHESSVGKVRNGKEWESFKKDRDEDLILKKSDFDKAISMRDALRKHPRVKELLDARGTGEMGLTWIDSDTGLECKGLIDRFCDCWGWSIILDLKSCQDARPEEFQKTVYNLQYFTKAAWYLDGMAAISDVPRRFLWIAIESEPYHGINIFDLSDEMLSAGRAKYKALLSQYAECRKTGIWPGYELGESDLELPKWAK